MAFSRTFRLTILTPAGAIEDDVEAMMVLKPDGYAGILPDHAGYLTKIENGVLTYYKGDEEYYVATGAGHLRFEGNQALILVDEAERGDDLDILLEKAKSRRAEEEEIEREAHETFERVRIALLRALEKRRGGILAGGRVGEPEE